MIELARVAGVTLPADTPEDLARAMYVREARSLEEYLERYEFTLAIMQTPEALTRIAYEFLLDSAADNTRYVEVRYCPALHSGMSLQEAFEAPLEGLRKAGAETGTRFGIIISALRTLPPKTSMELARAAVDYISDGVVAFDLAGAERGHPAREHAGAFEYAQAHGLARTCHAGEGDGPESVRQALEECRAQRIGHGTRIHEDSELEELIREHHIPLEVCLTSNLHTHTVPDIAKHPIRGYFDRGVLVTINTDSRLMDGISLSDEYWTAHEKLGFNRNEIDRLILNGFESAFLPDTKKRALVEEIKRQLKDIR